MDEQQQRIDRLEDFALAFDEELTRLKKDWEARLNAAIIEASANTRLSNREDIRTQAIAVRCELSKAYRDTEREMRAQIDAEIRASAGQLVLSVLETAKKELVETHKRAFAQLVELRRKALGVDDLRPVIETISEETAVKALREQARVRSEDEKTRALAAQNSSAVDVFAMQANAPTPSWADVFRGVWKKNVAYRRGDIFAFRGSSYLVLRDCVDVMPTLQTRSGPNPFYAVIAAAGAPGGSTLAISDFVTSSQFLANAVQNHSSITGLASAVRDATKLAGMDAGSSGFPVGACITLNFAVTVNDGAGTHAGTLTLIYQVQASTSNTAPYWYRPWNYDAGTNAVAYRLLAAFLDTLPAAYNATTGKFHYLGVSGAANAVYQFADQVGTAAPA